MGMATSIHHLPKSIIKYMNLALRAIGDTRKSLSAHKKVSVLASVDIDLTAGRKTKGMSTGAFGTFKIKDLMKLAKPKLLKGVRVLEIPAHRTADIAALLVAGEYGFFEAEMSGQTSDIGAGVGAGVTGQVLAGDKDNWGGYGFDIALNMEADAIVVEGGGSVAAVFSAKDHGSRQMISEFIGFAFGAGAGVGPTFGGPVTVSSSCAYATILTSNKVCSATGVNAVKQAAKRAFDSMGNDWKDLWKKCEKAWKCRFSKCANAAKNWADSTKGCAVGSFKACTKFDKKHCGQRLKKVQGACTQFGKKRGGCRSHHTRRKCGRHGTKKECHWVKVLRRVPGVPYPCGTHTCHKKILWKRVSFPCGVKMCTKNIVKDFGHQACKTVVNMAHCAHWVTQQLGCRAWHMVRDVGKCIGRAASTFTCPAKTFGKCVSFSAKCSAKHAVITATDMFKCGNALVPFRAVNC